MRLTGLMLLVLFVVACGSGETTGSRLLGRLRNTSWEWPAYTAANLSIGDGVATVQLNETSVLSNGTIAVLEEDPEGNFVVFNIFNSNQNYVLGLASVDQETIEVSIITSSNDLAGYRQTHDLSKVVMKRR